MLCKYIMIIIDCETEINFVFHVKHVIAILDSSIGYLENSVPLWRVVVDSG
jgi:hypothetical protein